MGLVGNADDPVPFLGGGVVVGLVFMAVKVVAYRSVASIIDPVERLEAVLAERKAVAEATNEAFAELGRLAVAAIEEAELAGVSQSALARRLGLSRQRLWQMTKFTSP